MSAPVVNYDQWFKDQQYGPGAYPNLDDPTFLGQGGQILYLQSLRFQAETMRVHETVAPTTATAYDITVLSRRVPGYWKMMLSVAKADRAWDDWYGEINTPRSFLSRWSRSKRNLKDLVIKNQRATDQAVAEEEYQEESGDNDEGDDRKEEEEEEEDEDQSDDEDSEESNDEDEEESGD
ncbi:predicted protein [Sclerotinia sclerotiorum 1980 UF-70]|uniref:Uncharacterized protein n=2 Tax=Sclerotinia sclerotiorum (strain ATCC 18683 / 1980 / Ss-1) TaxID=665079 RepID=A7EFJ1_SCLS1|nr:predicted protein [Sclerotinia sclerotiorum 1980 UF-70]APA07192.1 hypothetical protein sscle_02g019620 [Sclerotinia sclerotiorum 1980 UF-70]EDO01607.1 predicted protein [Sclerotinia sclerotiorum 1980 UF-70]